MIEIIFENQTQFSEIPTEAEFSYWMKTALLENQFDQAEISLTIVDKTRITALNQKFRKKNAATNVLAFPHQSIAGIGQTFLGDIIICAAVVIEEAKQQQKSIQAHFAHLSIHGLLHLLGFDHMTLVEAEQMETKEIAILAKLDFKNPYE